MWHTVETDTGSFCEVVNISLEKIQSNLDAREISCKLPPFIPQENVIRYGRFRHSSLEN